MNSLQRMDHITSQEYENEVDQSNHYNHRSRKNINSRLPSVEECLSDQYNYSIVKGGFSEITSHYLIRFQLMYICTTQFKIYHQLERAELMFNDQPDNELCGQHLNQLPVHEFYSIGRVLIIEIDRNIETFNKEEKIIGLFEFLNKDIYQSDGVPIKSKKCDQIFLSSSQEPIRNYHNEQIMHSSISLSQRHNNNNEELSVLYSKKTGKFFSPNYPQFYNASISCKYYFLARPNERTVIKLKHIQLWSYKSCHSTTKRDTIHFNEITISLFDSNSFIQLEEIIEKPLKYELGKTLLFLCGYQKEAEIVSDNQFVMLTLQSHEKSNGARGFEGAYQFLSKETVDHDHKNRGEEDENDRFDEQLFRDPAVKEFTNTENESAIKNLSIQHIKHIWMNPLEPHGTIKSPNYPSIYPQNSKLLYIINIPDGKLLRLKFLDIQLGKNIPSSKCTQHIGDRIEIYEQNYLNSAPKLILCGTSIMKEQLIFNNQFEVNRVFIYFITDHLTAKNEHGFIISYEYSSLSRFISNKDNPIDNNKFIHVRKDLSDEIIDVKYVDKDSCQFTIKSYGKESQGILQIPNYLLRTQKSTKLNNCKWKLEGDYGQRIQIRFVQHFGGKIKKFGDINYNKNHKEDDLNGMHRTGPSFLNSLRCPTSMTLELISYRANILTTNNDIKRSLNDKLNSTLILQQSNSPLQVDVSQIAQSSSLSSSSSLMLSNSDYMESNSRYPTPLDPVLLCAGEFMTYSPASKGFMSGNVPRLDIILRINQSTNHGDIDRKQNFKGIHYSNLGYDIQYRFVTDYGVTASFGNQRKPGCFFEFSRSQSITGNFSSPNYPGLYPIDVVCEYRFSGVNVQRIDIIFLEFDVESTSKTCTDNIMGDSVEISSCYSVELLSSPKRRLCHKQNPMNPFKIQWYEPCLNLKFSSNEMYVRTGFFGIYEFHDAGTLQVSYDAGTYNNWDCDVITLINHLLLTVSIEILLCK
ncbi:Suppressor of lurcher protein [Schistosoma japonicum]|uniref:Suppressor of lurcher protein n=1 Tax=Schistosoma japonicum TaxID=6182 RepID=A0A4Z2CRJ7_SCHJA|nr:Suppressor of lurcher protein [Schistosoma japonicum]